MNRPFAAANRDAAAGRLMVIELNEFDPEFLTRMAQKFGLRNIAGAMALRHSKTETADRVEHHGLDPWVQWVGVHTGKPTSEHGVKRLGATKSQRDPQVWHSIAANGYSWGVWGAMNAPLGNANGCQFFMPDPWSFDETAYPASLNDLLALPRYAATNYLEMDRSKAMVSCLKLIRFFAPPSHWPLIAKFAWPATQAIAKNGPNVHTLATLLDYLSVLAFVKLRAKYRPDFSLIFLNHIAHLQHQFWTKSERPHREMELGLKMCDAMLGLLLKDRNAVEGLILMNGLRQKNVAGEGFHVYRQINPQAAVEALGIERGHVEQCMTHDAHIMFQNAADADHAERILNQCLLSDGNRAFFVEREGPVRVFYQLSFEHLVHVDTMLICGNYAKPFYEVFALVCERTGAHVPEGDIFTAGVEMPSHLQNHEVFYKAMSLFPKVQPEIIAA
jgi:hypothetical protein